MIVENCMRREQDVEFSDRLNLSLTVGSSHEVDRSRASVMKLTKVVLLLPNQRKFFAGYNRGVCVAQLKTENSIYSEHF